MQFESVNGDSNDNRSHMCPCDKMNSNREYDIPKTGRGVLATGKRGLVVFILVMLLGGLCFSLNSADVEIARVAKRAESGHAALTLLVYTDIHHDPKDKVDLYRETMDCAGKLMEQTRIDALWNLGDLINGRTTTKAEAIAQLRDVIEEENRITLHAHRVAGNHDNNLQSTELSGAGYGMEEVLSCEELNAVLENTSSSQKEHHSPYRPTDYYVDFEGIRVVCITAEGNAFQEETTRWLREEALSTTSQVLIFSHLPTRPEWGYHGDVEHGEWIEEALNAFIAEGGTVICYIHGHDHGDKISDTGAWKEVSIGCARFQTPKSGGTEGMVYQRRQTWNKTKYLFDVVQIDPEKREVRFIRFGAGRDRVIHY